MLQNMIIASNISHHYPNNRQAALQNVSIDIAANEHWVILGRNGSGKSTLVKLIAGLLTLQEGEILVVGKPVLGPTKQLIPGNKNIAFVDQNMVIEPYLTVTQNLKSGLIGASYTEQESQNLVEELLHIAQLQGYENQKVASLSLGQKQRLSLAKAFTFEKPILIFDEPFNNVDSITRVRFTKKLQELQQKTIISVVHSSADAFQLGQHVAILKEGKLEDIGPIQQVYNQPKTQYAAAYLGELLELKLEKTYYFRPQNLNFEQQSADDIKIEINQLKLEPKGDFVSIEIQTNFGSFIWQDSQRLKAYFQGIEALYLPRKSVLELC